MPTYAQRIDLTPFQARRYSPFLYSTKRETHACARSKITFLPYKSRSCVPKLNGRMSYPLYSSRYRALPSRAVVCEGKKTDDVAKKNPYLITGPVSEHIYFVSDVAACPRYFADVYDAARLQPNPASLAAIGITMSFSAVTGYVAGSRGYESLKEANKIDDVCGQAIGKISMARGGLETFGGIFFIPVRFLNVVAAKEASKTVQTVSAFFSGVGGVCFGLINFLMMIPSLISFVKGMKFSKELNEVLGRSYSSETEKLKKTITFLVEQLTLSDQEREKCFEKALINKKEVEFSQEDEKHLTDTDKRAMRERISRESGISDIEKEKLYKKLGVELVKKMRRKEAGLERGAGAKTVALVKKELNKGPLERFDHCVLIPSKMEKAITEAKVLIESIKQEINWNNLMTGLIVVAYTIGAVAFIAGSIASGGSFSLAMGIVLLISNIVAIFIDGYFLLQAYKSEMPNKTEKTIMMIAQIDLLLAVAFAMFFSTGPIGISVSLVVGILGTLIYLYSMKRWSGKEKKEELSKMTRGHSGQKTFGIPAFYVEETG